MSNTTVIEICGEGLKFNKAIGNAIDEAERLCYKDGNQYGIDANRIKKVVVIKFVSLVFDRYYRTYKFEVMTEDI